MQVGVAQVHAVHFGAVQVGVAEVGAAQVGVEGEQLGVAQVGAYRRVITSPIVPSLSPEVPLRKTE